MGKYKRRYNNTSGEVSNITQNLSNEKSVIITPVDKMSLNFVTGFENKIHVFPIIK